MPAPFVSVQPQDFGIGVLAPSGEGIHVKIGPATVLPAGSIVQVVDTQSARERVGGKLGDAAAVALGEGAQGVICLAITASVAGTAGAVTRTGTGTAVLALTGSAPLDDYQLRVRITRAGASLVAATAAMQISLNGGDTYGPEIAVPVSGIYVIPGTGITLTFTTGTFVVGDVYSSLCASPSFTTTDITNSLAILFARTELAYRFIHIVGLGSAAGVAAVNTLLEARATDNYNPRFVHALFDGADDTDAAVITAFAASTSVRVGVGVGYADVFSPILGRTQRRSAAWPIAGRYSARPIEEHPGRTASGPLKTVARLYRDESVTPALDDARMTTLRSIQGGFYVTRGRLLAPVGSDYEQIQNRQVMDRACEVAYTAWLRFLNDSIRVDAVTGKILEKEALRLEAFVQGQLRTALRNRISVQSDTDQPAVIVLVDRAENILSSKSLPYDIMLVPLGYAEFIRGRVRFFNPSLQPVPPAAA
jgi:hypothetical protein